jgi:cellulose biosynthesis protein BcsQ
LSVKNATTQYIPGAAENRNDKTVALIHQGNDNWRAVYIERCTYGSEEGTVKPIVEIRKGVLHPSYHHLSEKFNRTFKATIYEVFTKKCNVSYAIHEYAQNLYFLPASTYLRKITLSDFEKDLQEIASQIKKEYDFVFFDLAPSMYPGSTVPLFFSDYVIIPVNCPQGLSLLGLQAQAEIIVEVRKEKNINLDVLGILPAFLDQTRMSKDVLCYLQKHYEDDLLPAIRKNTALSQASSIGKTIFEYARCAKGAKDYEVVAKALLRRVAKVTNVKRGKAKEKRL